MNKLTQSLFILYFMSLTSCKQGHPGSYQQEYPVLTVNCSDSVKILESYSASIKGRQDIAIYPQVSGTIFRLYVQEGQRVKKGEILFVIDRVPYEAALRMAIANVHATQAQVETAQLNYNSKSELLREDVISEYEVSLAENALAQAKAQLDQSKAKEIDARNNLSYTEVKSPSDGVVGILPYREGALVNPSIPEPLTTVSDNSYMYIYFSMTENQLRAFVRLFGSPDEAIKQMPPIQLQLNDGTVYEPMGYVETISGVINPQTGTVSIRSVFPNENRLLFSGGIGNVIIPRMETEAIVIPQSATFELQDKFFVYKVIDGKAIAVAVKVNRLNNGNDYIVRSGLTAGDLIVSEGVGVLQDGASISIKNTDNK